MDALISIIVPVFDSEAYVAECLHSILQQTYKNLEILLIDDGSTDNSGKICDKYASEDSRIKVVHKGNGGVSSARNLGLQMAQGEYISFIDSDDFVDKEYISAMFKKIRDNNSDISFCKFSKLVDDKKVEIEEPIPEYINVNIKDESFVDFFCRFFCLKQNIFGSACRLLFKKELAKDICFNSDIKISEDLLFLANIMLKARGITTVNQHLYFYRQTSGSVSHSYKKNYLTGQVALYIELTKLFRLFKDRNSERIFRAYICLLCYYVISNELKFKQEARKTTIQNFRSSPMYQHFTLKNGFMIYGIKTKLKFLITWFLVKMRVI